MKDSIFSIRLPVTVTIRLDRVAKESRRSRNQVLELLIENGLPQIEAELKRTKTVKRIMP